MALDPDPDEPGLSLADLEDHDPCHGLYLLAQNVASMLTETIAMMPEAKGFARIVVAAEEEYMPSGPPMSPVSVSHFTMWSMFDVQFGSSRETMGSCILRVAPHFDIPSWLADTIGLMQQSRMGFFVHCGCDGEEVLLREVGRREVVSCLVPAGDGGREGEIWLARVLPPPGELCPRHIVFTSPYVIHGYGEGDFVDYLEREVARMMAQKKPPRTDDLHGHLMKYGPEPNHWNEYIFCACTGYLPEAVFRTGIPDIPESLPHASTGR